MSEEKKAGPWVELLKYPITIFSLLLALVIAKPMLGLQFGQIAKVGPGGIEFAELASNQITDLAGKLNGVRVEIEALKKATPVAQANPDQVQKEAFAATQSVSNQTAALANVSREVAPNATDPRKGYIWIGDFKGTWGKTMIGTGDNNTPVKLPPDKLPLGTTYTTLGNMVVRDGLPSDDDDYFRARPSLGVIPRGAPFKLVTTPVGIDRGYAVQYWAQIEWK
ncbi:hypothetical protein [Hydrogenophaga sp.]|uniref:hypothetical protein n=1 Tax=Hydrogenophaga sp. TaxID=1904254 RepID=UPI003F6EE633